MGRTQREDFGVWESTPTWVDNRSLAVGPLLLTWETWVPDCGPRPFIPSVVFCELQFPLLQKFGSA